MVYNDVMRFLFPSPWWFLYARYPRSYDVINMIKVPTAKLTKKDKFNPHQNSFFCFRCEFLAIWPIFELWRHMMADNMYYWFPIDHLTKLSLWLLATTLVLRSQWFLRIFRVDLNKRLFSEGFLRRAILSFRVHVRSGTLWPARNDARKEK